MKTTIERNFQYHPPTVATGEAHAQIRAKAKELAQFIDDVLPADAGREKASAITNIEQAMFWACAGIVRYAAPVAVASGSTQVGGLIARAFSAVVAPDGQAIPDDIQWMPPGEQNAEPFVNDEPKRVKFKVTAQMAEQFNRQLQELRSRAAAGVDDVPFLDFNHEDGEASAEVMALYWGGEDPKTGGIRAKVKWSAAGRAALEGKSFRRFSPQWFLDPDTLHPLGVGINLGGLVNRAAFKTIARVVAKDASAQTHNPKKEMTREEFQQLLADGLKPITDKVTALEAKAGGAQTATAAATAQAGGEDALRKIVTDVVKPLTDKLTAFETNETNRVKASAKAAVQPHVTRGAIAPEDKDTITFWENAWVANASTTEAQLAKLPGKAVTRVIRGNGTTTATGATGEHAFLVKAREFAKTHEIKDSVQALTAFASTAEGRELYDQYRKEVVPVKAA
jgi:hypothetical protein